MYDCLRSEFQASWDGDHGEDEMTMIWYNLYTYISVGILVTGFYIGSHQVSISKAKTPQ